VAPERLNTAETKQIAGLQFDSQPFGNPYAGISEDKELLFKNLTHELRVLKDCLSEGQFCGQQIQVEEAHMRQCRCSKDYGKE
jgi:hypothetical protein